MYYLGFAAITNTEAEVKRMSDFIETHKVELQKVGIQSLQESVKVAELNLIWHQQNGDDVRTWLKNEYGEGGNGAGNLSITSFSLLFVLFISLLL